MIPPFWISITKMEKWWVYGRSAQHCWSKRWIWKGGQTQIVKCRQCRVLDQFSKTIVTECFFIHSLFNVHNGKNPNVFPILSIAEFGCGLFMILAKFWAGFSVLMFWLQESSVPPFVIFWLFSCDVCFDFIFYGDFSCVLQVAFLVFRIFSVSTPRTKLFHWCFRRRRPYAFHLPWWPWWVFTVKPAETLALF